MLAIALWHQIWSPVAVNSWSVITSYASSYLIAAKKWVVTCLLFTYKVELFIVYRTIDAKIKKNQSNGIALANHLLVTRNLF